MLLFALPPVSSPSEVLLVVLLLAGLHIVWGPDQ